MTPNAAASTSRGSGNAQSCAADAAFKNMVPKLITKNGFLHTREEDATKKFRAQRGEGPYLLEGVDAMDDPVVIKWSGSLSREQKRQLTILLRNAVETGQLAGSPEEVWMPGHSYGFFSF